MAYKTHRINENLAGLVLPNVKVFFEPNKGTEIDPFDAITIQNVGQNPALNVCLEVHLEEWRDREMVESSNDTFGVDWPVFQPQERKSYRLPSLPESSYVCSAKVVGGNFSPDEIRFSVGNDPAALRAAIGSDVRISFEDSKSISHPIFMKDFGKPDGHNPS
ncbi:MAG: hypothetical protein F4X45_01945 [Chloroflexi bacterium]|nr:hypothetical protein [Chloroflexota bacterium]